MVQMGSNAADNLRISLFQTDVKWLDVEGNLQLCEDKLNEVSSETDIAVFPEMFATGFSMEPSSVCNYQEIILNWLQKQSQKHRVAIVAGLAYFDENCNRYFNRLVWVQADQDMLFYDKRHLFRMAGEDKCFSSGGNRLIVEYKGWRICPFVCYDLRFPVWSRNVCFEKSERVDYLYDCAIFIANWPEARRAQWLGLLKARAIENQSFAVGVNRVGMDNNGYKYSGDSVVFSPHGEESFMLREGVACVETVELDMEVLQKYRSRFSFVLDADRYHLE